MWEKSYAPQLCLVQVAVGDTIWLVDPLAGAPLEPLGELIADASGLAVETGPTECTAIGNALVQYAALEELASAAPLRAIVRASFASRRFEPDSINHARMQAAMARARQ